MLHSNPRSSSPISPPHFLSLCLHAYLHLRYQILLLISFQKKPLSISSNSRPRSSNNRLISKKVRDEIKKGSAVLPTKVGASEVSKMKRRVCTKSFYDPIEQHIQCAEKTDTIKLFISMVSFPSLCYPCLSYCHFASSHSQHQQ